MLRRMIYLSIKEMTTVANDVTASLTWDMTRKEDSHRGPAKQALCKMTGVCICFEINNLSVGLFRHQ